MATKINILVPSLSLQEEHDLRNLLADALHEFAGKRADAAEYVRNRYPGHELTWPEKAVQVACRVRLARKIHGASMSFKVTHCPPECIQGHLHPQQTEDCDGPASAPCPECNS